MDFNRIDLDGIKPGWGSMWQGGTADQAVEQIADQLMIVVMDRGELNEQFIDHQHVQQVLAVWIDDSPEACLSDETLLDLMAVEMSWLSRGGNIYDHCAAGVSRSGYDDVAVHMVVLDLTFDDALAYVRARRPQTNPNPGFVAQLRRLEPTLRALGREI